MLKGIIVNKEKFTIFAILTLLWIVLIFSFSLQPGEISSKVSMGFGKWLMNRLLPDLKTELQELASSQQELLHFQFRKGAHFTEFFVLGLFAVHILLQTRLPFPGLLGLGCCAFIAAADETLQLFVDGRSGRIADVVLDSAGAATGICLIILIKNFLSNIKKERRK